jgi:3-hydroxyisobutyryl-CoA hydrolase
MIASMAGIATHFVPSQRIPELIQRLSALESDEMEVVNDTIEDYTLESNQDAWRQWSLGGKTRLDIDRHFKHKTINSIIQSLETDSSNWAKQTLKTLKKMSPTSLMVTLMALRRGEKMNFIDCFDMEYRLSTQFLKTPDFHEGVRALLVDKNNDPRWNPNWEQMDTLKESQLEKQFFANHGRLNFYNGDKFMDYPHRTLSGLPNEKDILRIMAGKARRRVTTEALTSSEDVLKYLARHWGAYDRGMLFENALELSIDGGVGRGKNGLLEKSRDILERIALKTKL